MSKIIYWIGVYAICSTIHDILDYKGEEFVKKTHRKMEKRYESIERNKEPIGIRPEQTRKPMNKIGFAINSDQ